MVVDDGCGISIVHEPQTEAFVSIHLEGASKRSEEKVDEEDKKTEDEGNSKQADVVLLAENKGFQHNRSYNERPRLSKELVTEATAAFMLVASKR